MSCIRWMAAVLFLLMLAASEAHAADAPFTVAITAPTAIEEYPGVERPLTVTVSNTSKAPVRDLLIYVTMADMTRDLVVDLSDFGASKVYAIDTIDPMKSISLEVPLKLAFTGNFYLYMTAVAKDSGAMATSHAIPVKIYGATAPSETLVVIVSAAVPGILLVVLLWGIARRSIVRNAKSA